ncbi:chemotaxis protein [Dechloromonas sp. ZS-1]|uniref:chemotaxis protein n=1 Tax=Dechloromonas sp. ZS-1 TaxID=3138067 RepID=UPI0031FCD69C
MNGMTKAQQTTATPTRTSLLASVDARTQLAGTNRLEMLLFTLGIGSSGIRETYGINVFKVREVLRTPQITAAPDMPSSVKGVVSLRGVIIPVIDLAEHCGVTKSQNPQILIITEYNRSMQGFLVEAVDTILRLDWEQMRTPPGALASSERQGLIVAIAEVAEKLILMLDVEKVLVDVLGDASARELDLIESVSSPRAAEMMITYADDSSIARKIVGATIHKLGFQSVAAINGKEAWEALQGMAEKATADRVRLAERMPLLITDVEMPQMDGYVLTKKVRADPRFEGVRVLMFSSLSSVNTHLGETVGIDAYIPKLNPNELAAAIKKYLPEFV